MIERLLLAAAITFVLNAFLGDKVLPTSYGNTQLNRNVPMPSQQIANSREGEALNFVWNREVNQP
jgi:hypothetical protein